MLGLVFSCETADKATERADSTLLRLLVYELAEPKRASNTTLHATSRIDYTKLDLIGQPH